ncbi:cobalt transporter CbiM [Aliarcobacter butzleri]|uniref:Cobalt transporter CbiM n=4 Tax=Aliarcobacter butzleri TaxID=28197 RepID=A0AAP4PYP0_9BACT|nr:cobalt transporter CbiM [Aliarcobacter butzleri]AGR77247.1 putative ABC-type Co/Ni periplasmic permease CbiKLMQO, membrane protein CbiM [Aliarcobacter butzleri 7h1h]KLE01224.1 cobalamin biosynthesis protein [Aliarcobacter butzleri L348]MCG3664210.1 cobalt transporter CbiM [Aliarcobacter butzleri]MCG3666543.1 cobalt transporter CbiM [Aliarcobacter butzleri]MCG3673882.1 cobalt transporter CbiM [Aliarcobacter butzleri]
MHISDGIISIEVATVSAVATLAFCVYSFKNLTNEKIALVASMSALFFVTSFIHIPFGVTQIHLMLIGFIGIFLGSVAFISIAIALILQALLLGFGGLSSLGANILVMALPAYLVYLIFKLEILKKLNEKVKFFLVGFLGVFISSLLLFTVLVFSKDEYLAVAYSIIAVNIPTMILEGIVTMFLLLYIKKSMPKLLKETSL